MHLHVVSLHITNFKHSINPVGYGLTALGVLLLWRRTAAYKSLPPPCKDAIADQMIRERSKMDGGSACSALVKDMPHLQSHDEHCH